MSATAVPVYQPRILDREIRGLLDDLPAILIEGAKGVGKTSTASRLAKTIWRLDDSGQRALAAADPSRMLAGDRPVLIDEWQRAPESWDLVRRAVDDGAPAGSFLLTGSASPGRPDTHSGAGRIVTLRMRPMSLAERLGTEHSVSLSELLDGGRPAVIGDVDVTLEVYVEELVRSGFPRIRDYRERARRTQLDSYLERIVSREFPDLSHPLRNPQAFLGWLRAYAAASSTTSSYEVIRDAATPGQADKPAKTTVMQYRDVLSRLWLLDPVPAWLPSRSQFHRLSSPPKHQLADPALAARLLGATAGRLLSGSDLGPSVPRDGTLLGALFESLVTLSVRTYAQAAGAQVKHLRTKHGEREIDLIIERDDGRLVAMEIKLARTVDDDDARHLKWLAEKAGDDVLDLVIVTTGPHAYRRMDGVAVVPAALLGP